MTFAQFSVSFAVSWLKFSKGTKNMKFSEIEKRAIFTALSALVNDYAVKGVVNRDTLANGVIKYLNSPGDRVELALAIRPFVDYVAYAFERDIREAAEFQRDLVKSYQGMA